MCIDWSQNGCIGTIVRIIVLAYQQHGATTNTSWVDVDILIQSNCLHPASQLLQLTCYHQYKLGGCWYFDTIKLSTSCLSTIAAYLLPPIQVGWMLIFWYNQTVYILPLNYCRLLATTNTSWVDVDILIQSNCLHPASQLLQLTCYHQYELGGCWYFDTIKLSTSCLSTIAAYLLPPIQVGWMLIFWYNQTVYVLPLNYCRLLATINMSWVDVDILIQSNCLHPASQLLQLTCYHQYELGGCWYFDTIKLSTSCLSTIPVYLLPSIRVGWMLIFWYNQTVYILPLNYSSLLATINTSWVDVDILIQSNCLHPASQLFQFTCYHQYELGGCWYFDTIKLSTSCLSTIPVYLLPSIRVGWMLIF